MSAHTGQLMPSIFASPSTTNSDFGNMTEPSYSDTWFFTLVRGAGASADTQPIDELGREHNANHAPAYNFLDFYNRIHISIQELNLGNVISLQQRTLSVFNAYFVDRTLNAINATGDDGLTLIQPVDPPYTFAPLQELIYTLQASTSGPPTIDATYTFDFDVRDLDLHVTGVRIVAWYWEVNWVQPVIERLGWTTEVLENHDGSEQRIAKRAYPRMELEFNYDVSGDQRRIFENMIYGWGARIWALPIWQDVTQLDDELLTASTEVPVATTGRDYHIDGLAILIHSDTFETVEIESFDSDSITVKRPLLNTWPAGTRVYPARTARMLEPRSTARYTRNYARGLARFKTVEEIPGTALTETTYRGYPVMQIQPNWRESPEIDYVRKLAERSFGTGRDSRNDSAGIPLPSHTFRWTMLNRTEADYFKQWLYARKGMQKALWLPTWSDDLHLATTVASSATVLDVEFAAIVQFAAADVHRRDIRVELKSGAVYYRRVSGFVSVDAETERMTISSAFGVTIEPEDIERISWMHLARLDNDTIELTWQCAGVAEAQMVMKAPRNDV